MIYKAPKSQKESGRNNLLCRKFSAACRNSVENLQHVRGKLHLSAPIIFIPWTKLQSTTEPTKPANKLLSC